MAHRAPLATACAAALALAGLALPAALAGHAVYVDEARVLGCLLKVEAGGIAAGLNCDPATRTVAAAEPAGGQYRLTATWSPVSAEWAQLEAVLKSCLGPCPPAGSGACLNNQCIGNPGGGNVVQHAGALGASPLVLAIPTAGNEDNVTLVLKMPGPAGASLRAQPVAFRLEHAG